MTEQFSGHWKRGSSQELLEILSQQQNNKIANSGTPNPPNLLGLMA